MSKATKSPSPTLQGAPHDSSSSLSHSEAHNSSSSSSLLHSPDEDRVVLLRQALAIATAALECSPTERDTPIFHPMAFDQYSRCRRVEDEDITTAQRNHPAFYQYSHCIAVGVLWMKAKECNEVLRRLGFSFTFDFEGGEKLLEEMQLQLQERAAGYLERSKCSPTDDSRDNSKNDSEVSGKNHKDSEREETLRRKMRDAEEFKKIESLLNSVRSHMQGGRIVEALSMLLPEVEDNHYRFFGSTNIRPRLFAQYAMFIAKFHEIRMTCNQQLQQIAESHNNELKLWEMKCAELRTSLQREHETKMQNLRDEHEAKMGKFREEQEAKMAQFREERELRIQKLKTAPDVVKLVMLFVTVMLALLVGYNFTLNLK